MCLVVAVVGLVKDRSSQQRLLDTQNLRKATQLNAVHVRIERQLRKPAAAHPCIAVSQHEITGSTEYQRVSFGLLLQRVSVCAMLVAVDGTTQSYCNVATVTFRGERPCSTAAEPRSSSTNSTGDRPFGRSFDPGPSTRIALLSISTHQTRTNEQWHINARIRMHTETNAPWLIFDEHGV